MNVCECHEDIVYQFIITAFLKEIILFGHSKVDRNKVDLEMMSQSLQSIAYLA